MKTIRHLLLLAILAGSAVTFAEETSAFLKGETYAVIISGGRNKIYNHERYWNDCAFLYCTLRQDCNISKDHITLLMADGDNPATDMLLDGATGLASSPTDLDGDGQPDLTLAATRQNLDDTFQRLSMTLTASDHLFLFITDHGEKSSPNGLNGPTPNPSPEGRGETAREASPSGGGWWGPGLVGAFPSRGETAREASPSGGGLWGPGGWWGLWLWGNEQLTPDELAAIVSQCHPATMNILLGQCYAGAFVAPLQGEGRIITAACAADQMSWKCKDRPYDEFVYHWTCAIAQHDEQGQPVNADHNRDGRISMQEAFDYARQHDRRPETPSITSAPVGFADGWSFSGIVIENGIQQIPSLRSAQRDACGACRSKDSPFSNLYDLQGRKVLSSKHSNRNN